MAELKTREQFEAEWWSRWHAEDYTWEGLKKKPLKGWVVLEDYLREAETGRIYGQPAPEAQTPLKGRAASLQDYWRANPKTGMIRDDSEIAGELTATDGQKTYHLVHLPLFFEDKTPTQKESWAKHELNSILVPRLLVASETSWKDYLFGQHEGADGRAQFQGGVWLCAPESPRGDAAPLSVRYDGVCFSKHAIFHETNFSGQATFRRAIFLEDAVFYEVSFLAEANFEEACFAKGAVFPGAKFSGIANFSRMMVSEVGTTSAANYHVQAFGREVGGGGARFNGAAFSKEVFFDGAHFASGASFFDVRFLGKASFYNAIFSKKNENHDAAIFDNAVFSAGVRFIKTNFSKMRFVGTIFERPTLFSGTIWPESPANWHAAFKQAIFHETVTFSDSGLKAFAAFDGVIFERGIRLDEPNEEVAKRTFEHELLEAAAAVESGSRLRELERGCRALKQAMEKSSNKPREQLFYRFELKARRAQDGLPVGEKLASYLYSWTSDYGASIVRPAIWLMGLMLVFGLIYWGAATGFRLDPSAPMAWGALADAMSVSASRIFPFGAYEWVTRDWMCARLGHGGPGLVFFLRFLATLQTALSLALIFRFGLAIRRRFQIS